MNIGKLKILSTVAVAALLASTAPLMAQEVTEPVVEPVLTMEGINAEFEAAREDRKTSLAEREKEGDESEPEPEPEPGVVVEPVAVVEGDESLTNQEQMEEINAKFAEAREKRKEDLRARRDERKAANDEAKDARDAAREEAKLARDIAKEEAKMVRQIAKEEAKIARDIAKEQAQEARDIARGVAQNN